MTAALWWHATNRKTEGGYEAIIEKLGYNNHGNSIDFLKTLIGNNMTDHLWFNDVRTNDFEVAGGKFDVWASIAYFPGNGLDPENLELVMTAGETADDAKAVNDELVFMLEELIWVPADNATGGRP